MTVAKGKGSKRHHEIEQKQGDTFYAYPKIKNNGATAEDFKIKVYMRHKENDGKDFDRDEDFYQGSIRILQIKYGEEIRYPFKMKASDEPGEYYVYFHVTSIDEDSNHDNNSSDEDDKETYAKVDVEEILPDLIITDFHTNDYQETQPGGERYGFVTTVENRGEGETKTPFQLRYQIRKETESKYQPIGESTFKDFLNPDEYQEHSTGNRFATPRQEGFYYACVCADPTNQQSEEHENNNCSEEIRIYVLPPENPELYPVFRFWSDLNKHHFYTISEDEKNKVIADYPENVWKYETIAYSAYKSKVNDQLFPVFRFWSKTHRGHFYTISEKERDEVIAKYPEDIWRYEGVAFLAYKTQQPGTVPLYRFYFYTASKKERDDVIANYPDEVWHYERVAFYVFR